jgi:hypothetical protein
VRSIATDLSQLRLPQCSSRSVAPSHEQGSGTLVHGMLLHTTAS